MQLEDYPNTTFCFVIKRERKCPHSNSSHLDDEADLTPPHSLPLKHKVKQYVRCLNFIMAADIEGEEGILKTQEV